MLTIRTKHLRATLLGLGVFHLLWLGLWLILRSPALPPFWQVYAHLPQLLGGDLPLHLLSSLGRVLVGISISLLLALPLSLALFASRRFGRILEGLTYLSYPIPKLALLPIVMLLCGLGEATKLVMIVLIILFQIVLSLRDALKAIPRDSVAVLRSLGASRRDFIRHLYLPAIFPSIFGAMRVGLGTALSVLFVTETYGTSLGMGYYIVDAWMRVNYLDMYAGIVLLSLLGFGLFVFIDVLEYIACPWGR